MPIPVDLGTTESFIGAWILDDPSVCTDIIRYFDNNPARWPGLVTKNADGSYVVDKKSKISTDCSLEYTSAVGEAYLAELKKVALAYMDRYPRCNEYGAWGLAEKINIQHYPPAGGYFNWHCERGSAAATINARHLVFMTYLNDVTDGGETEFYHQGLKVRPQQGLTLIWPVDWTYTHRGLPSMTQEKYITTGWFSFI